MTSTQINQENYTAYQPYMLLDFNFSFQNDVLKDDLVLCQDFGQLKYKNFRVCQ